jgi:hypothetical protein
LKRDFALSGIIGLFCGVSVYTAASALCARLPTLFRDTILVAIAFAFFLLLALIEMPMMVFGLRQMARSASTPHRLLLATFGFYVAFASVYASALVLLTGQIALGLVIAGMCLARFGSGIWIK